MGTLTEELAGWASDLSFDDLPDRVAEYATSQLISQLAAARAGLSHPLGRAMVTAFGDPRTTDARSGAAALAGLTAWLHFDDTAYAGHVSNSTATVPIAYALGLGLCGADLLVAMVAANECASRITAAATLGPFRGQNAAHTHLAGAVAGRLRCEAAPARRWVDAFGIAFALAPWPVQHGFLGSHAKLLSALNPVRTGLDACDAAAAGLAGAPDILEHPAGFLARFASVPLPDAVTAGLGRRWHTETLSFKVHPGGPGADAAVDCAVELYSSLGPLVAAEVEEIVVAAPIYTVLLEDRISAYLDGPRSPVSALVFSVPYLVATALLTGGLAASDLAPPAVDDPDRWALAAKVRVEHDEDLSRAMMRSDAPFGEALRQAGPQARAWLEEIGGTWLADLVGEIPGPTPTFRTATKATGARVTVRCVDGRTETRARDIPVGAIGPDTRRRHRDLVREKFLSTGGAKDVADGLAEAATASPAELRDLLLAALTL